MKELDAGSVVDLLQTLHDRLFARSARVGLYVVGGAAMLLAHGRQLGTGDVDVAGSTPATDEVARDVAIERGLAMGWLNAAAAPWVPPSPECAQARPGTEGLTVHVAPPRHLLAMKLAAWRPKDEEDLVDLLQACDLSTATAEEVADVLYEVYTVEDSLPGLLSVPGSDPEQTRVEAVARARDALALL
ncbi:nucleotidyltransferase [Nocardioides panacisoli]|uniref:nucleotidyltransferase n=1 Tax=Nocardioides panacisoli TaxID=627624 RepID=UPI001C639712|nr:nucleotidyltransferase [Nocardioides panacisoli]QYJ03108.1 nucleotidyltransferase [Nocardioides panacisoli]